jgi:hypothetical protein
MLRHWQGGSDRPPRAALASIEAFRKALTEAGCGSGEHGHRNHFRKDVGT